MPDWTYHPVFKPILFRLPAAVGREFIHRTMSMVSAIPYGPKLIEYLGHTTPSVELETEIFGLKISNPVGLSGKIDPGLTGTRAFSYLGLGFIEVGPITSKPKDAGVPKFTQTKDNLIFPYPLESLGVEQTLDQLQKLQAFGKPIFIRIGKADCFDETLTLVKALSVHAKAIILEDRLSEKEWKLVKSLSISMPFLYACASDKMDCRYIGQLISASSIDGIVIDEAAIESEAGWAYSQDQTVSLSIKVSEIRKQSSIPIIVSGGIAEPKNALALFQAGADAVMLTAGYVFTGPGLPKRINESLLDSKEHLKNTYSGWVWYWLFGFFMLISGLITLLVSMTIVIMPYDEWFLKLTREEILAINPNIYRFMQHDRMTVAGTMMSGGVLYMQLARYGVRQGLQWAKRAVHIAGVIGFLGILLFLGFGYFDWLHGILWLILLPFFWKGYLATKNYNEHSVSSNRSNHKAWKKSLWGQLAFVALGFALAIGGLVISIIGITGVFVQTDIAYICMTPEQLTEINNRLLPVIAHDRAGLGSALISVGLLVLMLALWGFQEGQRWVWYTFLFGGIPAFSAAITIHYIIGYTTFIHILPAYIALLLFAIGLLYSRDYFFMKS